MASRLPEKAKSVVSEMYAVILAAAFAVLVSSDQNKVVFVPSDWKHLGLCLALFIFWWIEWLWHEHWFEPDDNSSTFRFAINLGVQVVSLWCLCFTFLFFVRGDDITNLKTMAWHNSFGFWFSMYLLSVIPWGILNRKPIGQNLYTVLNICAAALFISVWLIDGWFEQKNQMALKVGIVCYVAVCMALRLLGFKFGDVLEKGT